MLSSLRLYHWRNIQNQTLSLESNYVYLVGNNGQGKSNLLEAIYYLIYQSSWRSFEASLLVTQGTEEGFLLSGIYKNEKEESTLSLKQKGNEKAIKLSERIITDRKDLFNIQIPLIFSPEDLKILQGSPNQRRRFLDQTLTLLNSYYLFSWRSYFRILSQRNHLLKGGLDQELDAFDIPFSQLASSLLNLRDDLIKKMGKLLNLYLEKILPEFSEVQLYYESSLLGLEEKEIVNILRKKRSVEKTYGTSLFGPHRDKLVFKFQGKDLSFQASQGQMRAFVLVLRLIQAQLISSESKRLPTLLLDDILLELDRSKRLAFFDLLPLSEQVICTFLPNEDYKLYIQEKTLVYSVENGVFSQIFI